MNPANALPFVRCVGSTKLKRQITVHFVIGGYPAFFSVSVLCTEDKRHLYHRLDMSVLQELCEAYVRKHVFVFRRTPGWNLPDLSLDQVMASRDYSDRFGMHISVLFMINAQAANTLWIEAGLSLVGPKLAEHLEEIIRDWLHISYFKEPLQYYE